MRLSSCSRLRSRLITGRADALDVARETLDHGARRSCNPNVGCRETVVSSKDDDRLVGFGFAGSMLSRLLVDLNLLVNGLCVSKESRKLRSLVAGARFTR
jgi:hypothetical protein